MQAVYLTDDRFTAENYTNFDPDEDWAMLKIPGSLLQAAHLLADDYEFREMFGALSDEARIGFGLSADSDWSDHGWEASLAVCNQVAYAAAIPVSLDMVEDIHPSKAVAPP